MYLLPEISDSTSQLIENLQDIPLAIQEGQSKDFILKPKQKEALGKTAQKILRDGCRAAAIVLPTATGKMVTVARMIAAVENYAISKKRKKNVLFLCEGITGILQARDKLNKFAGIEPSLYYGSDKSTQHHIVLTTFNSWQSPTFPVIPETIDLVIIDEAHLAISDARLKTLNKYKNAVWIGLTASPDYSEDRSLLHHFDLGYRMNVRDAVQNNLIAGFRNILVESHIDIDLDHILMTSSDNYEKRSLARALNTQSRNRIGAEYLLFGLHPDSALPIRNLRGIISCVDTYHSRDVETQYNTLFDQYFPGQAPVFGFVKHVDSYTKNRLEILQWHKEGKIAYLSFADMLIHNYDDPGISVCLNLRLSRSKVIATQRAGRAKRIDKQNPKKIALIVDVLDHYKGEKNKKHPLLYAEAVGEAVVIPDETRHFFKKEMQGEGLFWEWGDRAGLPPEIKAMIWNVNQRVVYLEEAVLSVIHKFKSAQIPPISADDLTAKDLSSLSGLSETVIRRIFKTINEEWEAFGAPDSRMRLPEVSINLRKGIEGHIIETISVCQWEAFKSLYVAARILRPMNQDDLTINDVIAKTGLRPPTVEAGFNKLTSEWKKYRSDPLAYECPSINIEYVKDTSYGGKKRIVIPAARWHLFREKYLPADYVPNKESTDLSVPEIANKTNLSEFYIRYTFKKIKDQWAEYMGGRSPFCPTLKIRKVKSTEKNKRVLEVISLSEWNDYYHQYIHHLTIEKVASQHMTAKDIEKKTGLSPDTIRLAIRKVNNEWGLYKQNPLSVDKPLLQIFQVKDRMLSWAINASDWEAFKRYLPDFTIRLQEEDDIDAKELELVSGYSFQTINDYLRNIYKLWEQHRLYPDKTEAPSVPVCLVRDNKGIKKMTIKRSEIEKLIKSYLPNAGTAKGEDQLSAYDMAKIVPVSVSIIRYALRKLASDWEKYNSGQYSSIRPAVEISYARLTWKLVLVINRRDLETFKAIYLASKIKIKKSMEYLEMSDISRQFGLPHLDVRKAFEDIAYQWKQYAKYAHEKPMPDISLTKGIENGRRSFEMIHRADLHKFFCRYFPGLQLKTQN
ncbi:MAG: hypothetical protein BGO55_20685 [Sphingobacteriales bacterium 50-39]|nr:DEAD/DEAH box helicase family protein [Sphingobacteriales bacterium]OJW59106.1 MAG: hypothetical protein BGO55_20685 [Sphingobacteriales bacterium 50-39]